jgi:uncharacterized protein YndB with AHSA1/START domain
VGSYNEVNTIRLHRVLRATPERIYRAFFDADAWPSGFRRMDSRARFIAWTRKSAAPTRCRSLISPPARGHSFGGTYHELTPHERIRYTDKFDDPKPARRNANDDCVEVCNLPEPN